MYAQGRGVPQNLAKALKWYRRAADQGHPEAQHNLALMYATGTGLAQDLAQARTWLRKAADQGLILAQVRLAATYQHGYGTPPTSSRLMPGTTSPPPTATRPAPQA